MIGVLMMVMGAAGGSGEEDARPPVRLAVVGLTHTHVHWILDGAAERTEFELVGVYEPNVELARRFLERHNLPMSLHHTNLPKMLRETRPQGVTVFTSTYEHTEIVEQVAPLGIHVMVEKPLAVDMDHAKRMQRAVKEYGIHLVTNYATTWFASTQAAGAAVREGKLGKLRRAVFHHGHSGPVEIGCNAEFLEWLTDPKLNGGGAVTDFGCYGANIMTWLQGNRRPLRVTARLSTFKPDMYPKVDDDATIILEYPDCQAVIMASWNWPFDRKDFELYGTEVEFFADSPLAIRIRGVAPVGKDAGKLRTQTLKPPANPQHDPFAWFADVIAGEIEPDGLSSLENNLIVSEILDAAKRSAQEGRTIRMTP